LSARPWEESLERLGHLVAQGDFQEAETLALRLKEEREKENLWPPAALDGLSLYVFELADGEEGNLKLGKWADALNRLTHKILEGEFQEVARVVGVMKGYAGAYTYLVKPKKTLAENLPGRTCRLSPRSF
jgi:hypothetical protein